MLLVTQVVSHFDLESPLQNCLGQLLEQPITPENLFRGLILFKQVVNNGETGQPSIKEASIFQHS